MDTILDILYELPYWAQRLVDAIVMLNFDGPLFSSDGDTPADDAINKMKEYRKEIGKLKVQIDDISVAIQEAKAEGKNWVNIGKANIFLKRTNEIKAGAIQEARTVDSEFWEAVNADFKHMAEAEKRINKELRSFRNKNAETLLELDTDLPFPELKSQFLHRGSATAASSHAIESGVQGVPEEIFDYFEMQMRASYGGNLEDEFVEEIMQLLKPEIAKAYEAGRTGDDSLLSARDRMFGPMMETIKIKLIKWAKDNNATAPELVNSEYFYNVVSSCLSGSYEYGKDEAEKKAAKKSTSQSKKRLMSGLQGVARKIHKEIQKDINPQKDTI